MFTTEGAFQYNYAKKVAEGGSIPSYDKKVQWPEGMYKQPEFPQIPTKKFNKKPTTYALEIAQKISILSLRATEGSEAILSYRRSKKNEIASATSRNDTAGDFLSDLD